MEVEENGFSSPSKTFHRMALAALRADDSTTGRAHDRMLDWAFRSNVSRFRLCYARLRLSTTQPDRERDDVKQNIPPDLNARDYVLEICKTMRVEDHRIFDLRVVRAAWPPSGEADDRPLMGGITNVGEMTAFAKIIKGELPEATFTTIQAMQANLGQDFRVYDRPLEHGVEVHRIRAPAPAEQT
jgi:hypothetical protein